MGAARQCRPPYAETDQLSEPTSLIDMLATVSNYFHPIPMFYLDGVLRRHYSTSANLVQPWLLINTFIKGAQNQIICTLVALLNMPHDRPYNPKYPTRRKFTNDGRVCKSDVGGLSIVWVREGVANGLCATTLSM